MKDFKLPYILSWIIVFLMTFASFIGLLVDNIYQDNEVFINVWKNNDLITLVIALPLLTLSLIIYKIKETNRSLLIWISLLWYTLYNFAFYLFGTAFNALFLIYSVIFALSILTLIFTLTSINVEKLANSFSSKLPYKIISYYMFFVPFGLTTVYIIQCFNYIINGQVPEIIIRSEHPTAIVFALDLSLVVPFFILSGLWMLQRKSWGFILAVILNIKGAIYMLVLTYGSIKSTPAEVPLWFTLFSLSFIASIILLLNMNKNNT